MKKAITILLALCLLVALCACGKSESESITTEAPTEPVEIIVEEILISDTDNGAKAQLNVGKATTIHGVVSDIEASSCVIQLICPKGAAVHVEMPIEQLTKMNNGQLVAIEGIVSAYNATDDKMYTIIANQPLDTEVVLNWMKQLLNDKYSYYASITDSAKHVHKYICNSVDIDLLSTVLWSYRDSFLITDDSLLKEYLTGTWVHGGSEKFKCVFEEDGSFRDEYYDYIRTHKEGNWSVSNGRLLSFYRDDEFIYVFSDNVFLTEFGLFIKMN